MTAEEKIKRLDKFIQDWRERLLQDRKHSPFDDLERLGKLITLNTLIDFRLDQDTNY